MNVTLTSSMNSITLPIVLRAVYKIKFVQYAILLYVCIYNIRGSVCMQTNVVIHWFSYHHTLYIEHYEARQNTVALKSYDLHRVVLDWAYTYIMSMVWVCTASVFDATAPTLGLTRKLPFIFMSCNSLRESSRLQRSGNIKHWSTNIL